MKVNKYRTPIILFAVTIIYTLLVMFVDKQPIGPDGTSVGFASINGAVHNVFGYNHAMAAASYAVLFIGFAVVFMFALIGIIQLVKRKSLLKVDKWILGLGVFYVVVLVLYVVFEKVPINYRPILVPGETELEYSYPSSHAMAVCSMFGSAFYALKYVVSDEGKRRALKVCAVVLGVLGVATRFLAGVHWLTDIVGGILFAASFLSLYVAWDAD